MSFPCSASIISCFDVYCNRWGIFRVSPDYKPIKIRVEDNIICCGKVIGALSNIKQWGFSFPYVTYCLPPQEIIATWIWINVSIKVCNISSVSKDI